MSRARLAVHNPFTGTRMKGIVGVPRVGQNHGAGRLQRDGAVLHLDPDEIKAESWRPAPPRRDWAW